MYISCIRAESRSFVPAFEFRFSFVFFLPCFFFGPPYRLKGLLMTTRSSSGASWTCTRPTRADTLAGAGFDGRGSSRQEAFFSLPIFFACPSPLPSSIECESAARGGGGQLNGCVLDSHLFVDVQQYSTLLCSFCADVVCIVKEPPLSVY